MMINVDNIPDFLTFIAIAKDQNETYDIIGSEYESPSALNGVYVLFSPLFTVYMSLSRPIDKPIFTPFEFRKFKRIFIKDGKLHCVGE